MNREVEMKVGSYYFNSGLGVLECIAERDNVFIVENKEYGYHVNQDGWAIYADTSGLDLEYECDEQGNKLSDSQVFNSVVGILSTYMDAQKQHKNKNCQLGKPSKHSHYFKDVSQLDSIDVYAVLRLFEVTDPCIQHAVKKLLCTGKRGHKDFEKDVQDAIDSLLRCQELNNQFN